MCTLNNHILLSKLTPFECRVRPSLDIECFPQHQAKSSFFFPLQSLSALSERFFFYLFILSSIFKHWFGGDFKWDRTWASARCLEGNCCPQYKHSHPQTRTQNPNNWLWFPEELDGLKSGFSLWAFWSPTERMDAGEALPAACHFSYFAGFNGFSRLSFFCTHVHIRGEGKNNTKAVLNGWFEVKEKLKCKYM